jgi:hypothetical protein
MEVRTILWPTDLSKNSIKAAKHVSSLAEKYQAKVIMLYVGVDLMAHFPAYGSYPSAEQLKHFQDWEVKHAKQRMESVCDQELKACPNIQVRLVQGGAGAPGQPLPGKVILPFNRGRGNLGPRCRPEKNAGLGGRRFSRKGKSV